MDRSDSSLGLPEKFSSWRKFIPYVLLLGATFALYWPSLSFHFVYDDLGYVVENYRIQGHSPAHFRAIWMNSYAGQYAPLHHALLAFLYLLFQLNPFGYHLAQLLLHAACVGLVFFVLKQIESERVALLATAFFVVFPPNIETVAWVSETKSTLAFLFFLISFWFFLRLRKLERWSDGVGSAVFFLLSLLTKINTIVAPVIFLLYDYKQGTVSKKGRLWSLGFFFLIALLFTVMTLFLSSGAVRLFPDRLIDGALQEMGSPHHANSNGYFGGPFVHLLNLPQFFFFYLRMVFFPYPLSAWHMVWIYERLNWIVGISWFALLALLFLLYRCSREIQFWSLWFLVFLTPVLQIVPNSVWVADRYLYIPAIGAFVLLSKLFFYLLDRLQMLWTRRALLGAAACLLLTLAWVTHHHLPVWNDEVALWSDAAKTCRISAYCHQRLGKALLRNGQADAGVRELLQAVAIRPSPQYLIDLGDALTDQIGDYPRGLTAYMQAQRFGGRMPASFWGQVAKNYYLSGDLKNAANLIAAVQKIDVDDPGMLLVNGFVQWKQGNREQARQSLQRLMALNALYPRTPNAPAKFIAYYWRHPAEVDQLLADLGPL